MLETDDRPPAGRATGRRRRWIAAGLGAATAVAAAVVVVLLVTSGGASGTRETVRFHSAPRMKPPRIETLTRAHDTAPGYILLTPKRGPWRSGPMIADNAGDVVWYRPAPRGMLANNLQLQRYRGKPVLSWWQGHAGGDGGYGLGSYVVVDRHYREIAHVHARDGLEGDHHEFRITPRGTALFTAYKRDKRDLSSRGGSSDATVLNGTVQEVDIATGKLLFQWHSLDHVPIGDSYQPVPKKEGVSYDYFHVNSIDWGRDGNLLISARNTSAIYNVDRRTGRVIWQIGGKHSDFRLGRGARFAFQHDARWVGPNRISVFDNGGRRDSHHDSRALILQIDRRHKVVRLVRSYPEPDDNFAFVEGSAQLLPDGHMFVGWGSGGNWSEFDRSGALLYNARLPEGNSYRSYRARWQGRPLTRPAVAVQRASGDRLSVYASWNGATEVDRWRVLAAGDSGPLHRVRSARRDGFETRITIPAAIEDSGADVERVAVEALGADGRVLGRSRAATPSS